MIHKTLTINPPPMYGCTNTNTLHVSCLITPHLLYSSQVQGVEWLLCLLDRPLPPCTGVGWSRQLDWGHLQTIHFHCHLQHITLNTLQLHPTPPLSPTLPPSPLLLVAVEAACHCGSFISRCCPIQSEVIQVRCEMPKLRTVQKVLDHV